MRGPIGIRGPHAGPHGTFGLHGLQFVMVMQLLLTGPLPLTLGQGPEQGTFTLQLFGLGVGPLQFIGEPSGPFIPMCGDPIMGEAACGDVMGLLFIIDMGLIAGLTIMCGPPPPPPFIIPIICGEPSGLLNGLPTIPMLFIGLDIGGPMFICGLCIGDIPIGPICM